MPLQSDIAVSWPTVRGASRPPASVEIRQPEFRHDVAIVTYYVEPHAVQRFKEGTPIQVRWGTVPNNSTEFYGTVLFIRAHAENEKHALRVVCVGTSYPLKDAAPTLHVDRSIESVVSQMAAEARLDLLRTRSMEQWPMLVRTTGETGWQYLVRLAKRQGYTLFVNKTTMHYYDPVHILLAHTESWPVLQYRYGRGNDFRGDIISFTPEVGNQGVPGHEKKSYRIMSVDPLSAAVIDSRAAQPSAVLATNRVDAKFTGFLSGHPAHSFGDARTYVEGMQRANRWVHRATAQVWGNARLRQGCGVFISGVSKEDDGLWYVSEARHVISAEKHPQQYRYFTHLVLLRDSSEIAAVSLPRRRSLRNDFLLTGAPALVDGRWVSRHQIERVSAA